MFSSKLVCGAALLTLGSIAAQAAEMDGAKIVREGNGKGASACLACHGQDGAGQPAAGFPRLAGMNADYLAKQLHDMKQGLRSNPVMQPMAKALSENEIAATARFYAALPVPPAKEPAPSGDVLMKGELLAKTGNWNKGVPACFQCHGDQGQGVATHFPAIAPQSATYLANQLRDWKSGSRHNDPQGLMKTVAERLSEEDVTAVAAYLASRGAH
jgi:cytochrome c553